MDKKKCSPKKLRHFFVEISPEYPFKKAFLFGSRAWGKPRYDSDVDLLLVSEKFRKKERLDRSPPLYLKWNLEYPVDFLCLTPEEFEHKKKLIGIVQTAAKEGIRIV
ncbi:nucleotidyltransferase domain-containing protein [Candidatus Woesearchaeota archaeon]|nr:nucleotidyltransferase domain-containing protein [Candidatus Woesearchaeota archaeon]